MMISRRDVEPSGARAAMTCTPLVSRTIGPSYGSYAEPSTLIVAVLRAAPLMRTLTGGA